MEETNINPNTNENFNLLTNPTGDSQTDNPSNPPASTEQPLDNIDSLNQKESSDQKKDENSLNINDHPVIQNTISIFSPENEYLNSFTNNNITSTDTPAPIEDKVTSMKQKAIAMLKLKQKRSEDENTKEDEKDIKKRAVEDEAKETIVNSSNIINISQKNNENKPEENLQVLTENKPIEVEKISNINADVQENNVEMENAEESKEQKTDLFEKTKETPVNETQKESQIINQPVQPVEGPKESTEIKENKESQVQPQAAQGQPPASDVPQAKTGKKISFTEAKKEIDDFTSQIEKIETEIKDKYGINLPEYYYEDLLPDELKMKLIEDFFNSEEIIELAKKAASL
jgi:hypothetical protein